MTDHPNITEMKRSLLLRLIQYNATELSLGPEYRIRTMSAEEVNATANVLLEMADDLNNLRDQIEAAEAKAKGGDRDQ